MFQSNMSDNITYRDSLAPTISECLPPNIRICLERWIHEHYFLIWILLSKETKKQIARNKSPVHPPYIAPYGVEYNETTQK